MMHGRGKSDFAIVAVKPANKAEHPAEQSAVEVTAAEPVERRAETKGNAGQQSTCRTQSRASVSQALERIRPLVPSHTRGGRSYGAGRRRLWHLHCPYELMEVCPVMQVNDLSRSLAGFDQVSTLVVVVEMSKASWLVSGVIPGVERQPLKKLEPDSTALLRL